MNYLNSADMSLTNSLIAKYIYDNHNCFMKESINKISKSSDFSQSSISRFMKNEANTDLLSYRTVEFLTEHTLENILSTISSASDEDVIEMACKEIQSIQTMKNKLDMISKQLLSSKHILFVGHECALGTTYQLQSSLLLMNIPTYSPFNYANHEYFIKNVNSNDAIVVVATNNEFSKFDIIQNNLHTLEMSQAKKILISTIQNYKYRNVFDTVVELTPMNETFAIFKLQIFF